MRALIAAIAVFAAAGAVAYADTSPRGATEVTLRQAEEAWSEAFVTGDAATLDALLDERYVSIGQSGAVRPKAAVIELARTYAASHPNAHATPLPPTSHFDIRGGAAIVTHEGDSDRSVDVFYFDGGHWRAWYSQHTARQS